MLSKEERLQILKVRREEKEKKLKQKLNIYTSVRPYKADKEKEKAT